MPQALTVEQAAVYLQLSPYTIRQWLRTGKLPGRKIGRVYRILDSDLESFLTGDRKQYERPADSCQQVVRESGVIAYGNPAVERPGIPELLASKRQDILRIAEAHGASNVRVFGSAARGEADENSDIDFLVVFKPGTSLLQHGAMIAELEDLLGRRVDVAPEKNLKERIRERVLSEAIPL